MQTYLKNTYIKNDRGALRDLYFTLCEECGLHNGYQSAAYQWPWIYENGGGMLQHAPERRYVRGKREMTQETLETLYQMLST